MPGNHPLMESHRNRADIGNRQHHLVDGHPRKFADDRFIIGNMLQDLHRDGALELAVCKGEGE